MVRKEVRTTRDGPEACCHSLVLLVVLSGREENHHPPSESYAETGPYGRALGRGVHQAWLGPAQARHADSHRKAPKA